MIKITGQSAMKIKIAHYRSNHGVDEFAMAVPKELRRFFGNRAFIRHKLTGEGSSMLVEIQTYAVKYKAQFARYRQYLTNTKKVAQKIEAEKEGGGEQYYAQIEQDALTILEGYGAFPEAAKTPAKVPDGQYEYPHLELIEEYLRDKKAAGTMTEADKLAERLLVQPVPLRLSGCLPIYFANHENGKDAKFIKNTNNHWCHVVRELKDKPLEDIKRADAAAYIKSRISAGASTGTVSREISTILAVVNKAIDHLDLDIKNPFSRATIQGRGRDKKVRPPYANEQIVKIVEQCLAKPDDKKVVLLLCALSGCRLSEAAGLRRQDINLTANVPFMSFVEWGNGARTLKTKSSTRDVPLLNLAAKVLKKHLKSHTSDYAFPTYCDEKGVRNNALSAVLIKMLKKSGFIGMGVHNLRHSARTICREAQIYPFLIDAIGGWDSAGSKIGEQYGTTYSNQIKYEAMVKAYQPILDAVKESAI